MQRDQKGVGSNAKKIFEIFTACQRRRTANVVLILLIGAILEMFSIGLIVPLIGVMINGGASDSLFFSGIYSLIEGLSAEERVVYVVLFLMGAYIVKSLYLSVAAFYQSNYIYDIQRSIASRLVKKYILAPYAFHLQNNPSKLINNIVNEVNLFSINVTIPLNIILSELLVVVALLLLLLFYEPLGALIVVVFLLGSSFLFYVYMRKNIKKWGDLRQKHDEKRLKSLQEALYGSKEIKVLGKESWFLENFSKSNSSSSYIQAKQRTFLQLPRLIIEVFAIGALLLLILAMTAQKMDTGQMLMTIGLFSAISFRVAPSVNKVLVSFQEMKYASSIIDVLHTELLHLTDQTENIKTRSRKAMSFKESLEFDNVSAGYEAFKPYIVKNVNISILPGEFVGIVGESGSGKTTLLNLILGLVSPGEGSIKVDGTDISSNIEGWRANIGYVPQSVYLTNDSIKSNIAFGTPNEEINDEILQNSIRMSGLDPLIKKLKNGVNHVVGDRGSNLSGGQIQRIGIARALYNNPSVLILDESTSALDDKTEKNFLDTVESLKGKVTIIFVTHKKFQATFFDRILRMRSGELTE